jgi:hypothetical protein
MDGSHWQGRRKQGRAGRTSELFERTTREGIEPCKGQHQEHEEKQGQEADGQGSAGRED